MAMGLLNTDKKKLSEKKLNLVVIITSDKLIVCVLAHQANQFSLVFGPLELSRMICATPDLPRQAHPTFHCVRSPSHPHRPHLCHSNEPRWLLPNQSIPPDQIPQSAPYFLHSPRKRRFGVSPQRKVLALVVCDVSFDSQAKQENHCVDFCVLRFYSLKASTSKVDRRVHFKNPSRSRETQGPLRSSSRGM